MLLAINLAVGDCNQERPSMETREARTAIKDIVFRRIGVDIPLTEKQEAFSGSIPARALAVSNRFGITFFVHSEGAKQGMLPVKKKKLNCFYSFFFLGLFFCLFSRT